VLNTDLPQSPELVRAPDPTHRVVRAAEKQHLAAGVCGPLRQVDEVDVVPAILQAQRVLQHDATVVLGGLGNRIEHGRLHDHCVAGLREHLDCKVDDRERADRRHDPVGRDVPTVAFLDPGTDCFVMLDPQSGVAQHTFEPAGQRLQDRFCRTEVHVGDPHWEQRVLDGLVRVVAAQLEHAIHRRVIPLDRLSPDSRLDFVEVNVHGRGLPHDDEPP